MEIFTGSAESAQFERFLKVLHGLRPVLGFRSFQTVAAQFLDSVIHLTLLLQALETLQEHLGLRFSRSAESMREGVESILVVRIRSDCDLQMMNSFLRIPKNDQV